MARNSLQCIPLEMNFPYAIFLTCFIEALEVNKWTNDSCSAFFFSVCLRFFFIIIIYV